MAQQLAWHWAGTVSAGSQNSFLKNSSTFCNNISYISLIFFSSLSFCSFLNPPEEQTTDLFTHLLLLLPVTSVTTLKMEASIYREILLTAKSLHNVISQNTLILKFMNIRCNVFRDMTPCSMPTFQKNSSKHKDYVA